MKGMSSVNSRAGGGLPDSSRRAGRRQSGCHFPFAPLRIKKSVFAAVMVLFTLSVFPAARQISAFAAEAEELSTEMESGAEAALAVSAEGQTVTLTNVSDRSIAEVSYDYSSDAPSGPILSVTEEDGTVHTFEEADLTEASDYSLCAKLAFLYVWGTDAGGEEVWFYETAEEQMLDASVPMYTESNVNIRREQDIDSEILGTADLGSEVEVLGGTPKWFLVNWNGLTGYISARYLREGTEEETEAESEAAAEEEAEAETEQPPETEPAAESETETPNYASEERFHHDSIDSPRTEVSREAVYDSEGSGHGYYAVTYSDGSLAYIDF